MAAGVLAAAAALPIAVSARPLPQNPATTYAPVDIAYGAQLYATQCAGCHGPNGDGVGGVDLRSGRFRSATTDQDLMRVITTGIPNTGMIGVRLEAPEVSAVVAYLRNMTSFDPGGTRRGDRARGRAVFEGRECLRCHRVGAQGARVAPDLSEIGTMRSPASLQRSITDPTSQMMPINRPVRIVTRDGATIEGRRLNEDTYTVQIIDQSERLRSFDKADLRELTVLKTSPMPAYKDLTPDELNDLLAYLLSLKGR
jgi:putative heme-binding domain-containing protein